MTYKIINYHIFIHNTYIGSVTKRSSITSKMQVKVKISKRMVLVSCTGLNFIFTYHNINSSNDMLINRLDGNLHTYAVACMKGKMSIISAKSFQQ